MNIYHNPCQLLTGFVLNRNKVFFPSILINCSLLIWYEYTYMYIHMKYRNIIHICHAYVHIHKHICKTFTHLKRHIWAWQLTSVIPPLLWVRQQDCFLSASLGYRMIFYLKNKINTNKSYTQTSQEHSTFLTTKF